MQPWPNRRAVGAGLAGLGAGALMGAANPIWPSFAFALGIWVLLWDFLSIKCKAWPRLKKALLACVAIILAGCAWYLPQWYFPIFDKNKIQIGLQYAYDWDNYKGSKNTENPEDGSRTIDKPIKAIYSRDKYFKGQEGAAPTGKGKRLILGVDNLHKKLSLRTVRLDVIFQDGDLEINLDGQWRKWVKNKHYFARLGNVVPGLPSYPSGNLWVKFPEPRTYKITCKIYGERFEEIIREVEIILRKPGSN